MEIAVLIIAHKNEKQLRDLVDILKPHFSVYLSIDRRSAIPIESFSDIKTFKSDRIYWGSYSFIKTMIHLLKTAFEENKDYFILISGQDMPILSCSKIKAFIESNADVSFVENGKLPRENWSGDGGLDRLKYFFGNHGTWREKTIFRSLRLIQRTFGLVRSTRMEYHGGASWFNLSRNSAGEVLRYIKERPSFLKRFKFTSVGDEIWLQTAMANAGCKKVVNNCLRRIDWIEGSPNPRIYQAGDFRRLTLENGDLFARKFDEKSDSVIIDQLDEYIRKAE